MRPPDEPPDEPPNATSNATSNGGAVPTLVDLDDVEADSAAEVLAVVDRLRARLAAGERLRVRNCPQMVAHTLYKAGLLLDGRLELESAREEEPYG